MIFDAIPITLLILVLILFITLYTNRPDYSKLKDNLRDYNLNKLNNDIELFTNNILGDEEIEEIEEIKDDSIDKIMEALEDIDNYDDTQDEGGIITLDDENTGRYEKIFT